ncbi:MAG: hypothetical protein K6E85_01705 [Lachnospiraceae bacterium]|nr:hypothetical protein [Lachnospiraceae bacterium]
MGEISTVDASYLERRIKNVEEATTQLANIADQINYSLRTMSGSIAAVDSKLIALAEDFKKMMEKQEKDAAFQQAQTELVTVRQEINQKFGKYDKVRDTMLGVLQATDIAVVKSSTIANVSEEIMIQTPEYWLAPCLVAIAAWIGNNRDLAERAIAEAVRRDEEKTALTMALICRRNNRVETCYEWLSIYFSHQDSADFTEATFTYLNAYVNGVFGPDERHICDDYVSKWIDEIQKNNSNLAQEQTEEWKRYCETFITDMSGQYPELKQNIREFGAINNTLGRMDSVNRIIGKFKHITESDIDYNGLKREIDENLINLVQRFDTKEMALRDREAKWVLVKEYGGNVEKAEAEIARRKRAREEHILNLVQTSSDIVRSNSNDVSKKKTAITFIGNYIKKGYSEYVEETKTLFPEKVTISIDDWQGSTVDGSNTPEMMKDYELSMNKKRTDELNARGQSKEKLFLYGAAACGVLGIVMLFIQAFFGVVLLAGAGILAYKWFTTKKEHAASIQEINARYDQAIADGKSRIASTMTEWAKARQSAEEFINQPVKEIIA